MSAAVRRSCRHGCRAGIDVCKTNPLLDQAQPPKLVALNRMDARGAGLYAGRGALRPLSHLVPAKVEELHPSELVPRCHEDHSGVAGDRTGCPLPPR
jgi:hypothetical protein